jgi:pyruvate,orthophosphate dikinase
MTIPIPRRIQTSRPRRGAVQRSRGRPASRARTLVFRFDQLPEVKRTARTWDEVKALLGGKGANLAEMTRLGLPVPPGFTVTTEACRAFLRTGSWPKGLWEEEVGALRELEQRAGKRLGDPSNPLLVSAGRARSSRCPG